MRKDEITVIGFCERASTSVKMGGIGSAILMRTEKRKMYTVSGKEGENFDVKKTKTTQTNGVTSEEEQQEEIEKRVINRGAKKHYKK